MIGYRPVPFQQRRMAQAAPVAPAAPMPPAPAPMAAAYTGAPGVLETVAVLGIVGSAAYVGIRAGRKETNKTLKIASYVGGVGSAVIGLLYLGQKTGMSQRVGLPAVRVSPA